MSVNSSEHNCLFKERGDQESFCDVYCRWFYITLGGRHCRDLAVYEKPEILNKKKRDEVN